MASQMKDRRQLELELPGDGRGEFVISVDTAHVRSADPKSARNSSLLWLDAVEEDAARSAAAIASPPAPINMRYVVGRSMLLGKKGIAALATLP